MMLRILGGCGCGGASLTQVTARRFSKLIKETISLIMKRRKPRKENVDLDPDKDKLVAALKRREKEVAELDNDKKCVSLRERLDKYTVAKDGKIICNFLDSKGKKREFKDMAMYKRYVENRMDRYYNKLKHRLTPTQLYVTQDCGFEKPFTSPSWSNKATGVYCCAVCRQRLFM